MEDSCYHCGDKIIGKSIVWQDKNFCCHGCESVFRILEENNLGDFYVYEKNAGTRPKEGAEQRFAFLDVPELRNRFIDYEDDKTCRVTLFLPTIHCSSCIYLLENLNRLNAAIFDVKVQFSKREAIISFDQQKLPFSELAYLLDSIGYAPNFGNRNESNKKTDKTYLYKLGVAGFAFGSIMLWSFPEYLGIENDNPEFRTFTSYLSFFVSIPVLFYSANEYLISAWKAVKHRSINLDVPITLGIIALYLQSSYMIFSGSGPGYMDSFASFIFFLLIGKWFQSKTYRSLAFDRDYSSYFPVAITRITNSKLEELIAIEELKINDRIRLKNEEIIPCDVVLESSAATVDYSFVTGEAVLVEKVKGDFIFAGAKIIGKSAECSVQKEAKRSHLTELWNKGVDNDLEVKKSDKFSSYFLITLCVVAISAAVSWLFIDSSKALEVLVAVLIVACPCALALSRPFTYGNIMRLLGKKGLYLKNSEVIEALNQTTDIVFDKTGTLTSAKSKVEFIGDNLSEEEKIMVFEMVQNSIHPYARMISAYLKIHQNEFLELSTFEEVKGKGMFAVMNGNELKLGSHSYVGVTKVDLPLPGSWLSINNQIKGKFCLESELRPGIQEMINGLALKKLHVLSGDSSTDEEMISSIFPKNATILFHQKPGDKLDYVAKLEQDGKRVLMIGDGLNDVGALKKATCGISISEDIFQFTPSSDAIIDARYLYQLPQLLKISKFSKRILAVCFTFSILYNFIGLSIAISGQLSPLVAAILMPISSVTVVFIATFGTLFFYPKK